eukprot:10405938-Karenia_brevis.AAC.1
MAQDVTKPAETAVAMGGRCGHHRLHALDKSTHDGGESSATISNISTSRRSGQASGKKSGNAHSSSGGCIQSLGSGVKLCRRRSGGQDRNLRGINSAGYRDM